MVYELFVRQMILPMYDLGKDLEVRVEGRLMSRIEVGDSIEFNRSVRRRVKAIRKYTSFRFMLDNEDPTRFAPGAKHAEVGAFLRALFPPKREKQGVIVFELEKESA